jgi:predicted dienelactone hydrolase
VIARLRLTATAVVVVALGGLVACAATGTRSAEGAAPKTELRLPPPTGTRAIGTATFYLVDRARRDPFAPTRTPRRLVVQLWYPAAHDDDRPDAPYLSPRVASLLEAAFQLPSGTFSSFAIDAGLRPHVAPGRHPLLLLSHGLGTLRELHTALAVDLASRGYIVAAIAHTYDAAAVELADGRVIRGTAPDDPTNRERDLLLRTRVADVRFVLDELLERSRLPTGWLAGTIASGRIGALGHSLGGATAAAAMLTDNRIRAGVDLDGSLFGSVVAQGLTRPFMLVVGDHDLTPDQAQFMRRLRSTRYALRLRGAGHYSFTDLPLFAAGLPGLARAFDLGTIDPQRASRALRAYVAAFFAETLLGRKQALLRGPSTAYPEARFLIPRRDLQQVISGAA